MANQFIKPLDITGVSADHRKIAESHALYESPVRLIIPYSGAYYGQSMSVVHVLNGVQTPLVRGQHWVPSELMVKPTIHIGQEIYCSVLIRDNALAGSVELSYQELGGSDQIDYEAMTDLVSTITTRNLVQWEHLDHPGEFPPAEHKQDISQLYGVEYLRAALISLKNAVAAAGEIIHLNIISQQLPRAQEYVYNLMNTGMRSSADLVYSLSDSSQEDMQNVKRELSSNDIDLNSMLEEVGLLTKRMQRLERDHSSDRTALSLSAIFNSILNHDGTFMPIAKYMGGLVSWIDMGDTTRVVEANGVLTVTDKADISRVFTGASGSLTTSNFLINSRVCDLSKQPDGIRLVSGFPITIGKSHTVIAVYAAPDSSTAEKFTLLSNDDNSHSFVVDISKCTQLGFKDSQGYIYRVDGVINDDQSKHMCAASIDIDPKVCHAQSSQPGDVLGALYDFEAPMRYLPSSVGMNVIGGADSYGVLAEIMVFNRSLSKYELDALGVYYSKKYNVLFTQLTNGSFCAGLHGFETDYNASIDAREPSSVAVIRKLALGTQTLGSSNNFYLIPNYSYVLKMMPAGNKLLAINTSDDITKAVWRVKLDLPVHARHVLRLSVLYNPLLPPILQLSINGEVIDHAFQLDGQYPRNKEIDFEVIPRTAETTLELRNINADVTTNAFAIDNISLIRAARSY